MSELMLDRPWPSRAPRPFPSSGFKVGYNHPQAGFKARARAEVDHTPMQNHLLAALPPEDLERLMHHLELVPMPLGEVLCQPSKALRHAYFPTTAIVSLHTVTQSGQSAESASVSNEGMVGVGLFMGGSASAGSASVNTAGHAYRLEAPELRNEFNRGGALQRLLLRYTQTLIAQTAQTAACNRHHLAEKQLSRWLLTTLDRLDKNAVAATQELVANMLGVRRECISDVTVKLQSEGIIKNRRGFIDVVDRTGLEKHACDCYGVIREEFRSLLADVKQVGGRSSLRLM